MTGPRLLALVGPTASGKTEASIEVARVLDAEIVCVDSMLVYRGMDVGTAKPTADQRRRVPHHLVDIADPTETFTVARFQGLAKEAIADIARRGKSPILVGGGGLYYRAVVDDLAFPGTAAGIRALLQTEEAAVGPHALHARLSAFDPEAASRIEPRNGRRTIRALEVAALTGRRFSDYHEAWGRFPDDRVRAAGIDIPRTVLDRRIELRVDTIMPGLREEARVLAERGWEPFITASQAIGYAEAMAWHTGAMTDAQAVASTVRRTKALARRQLAWLRRDPRVTWFPAGEHGAVDVIDDAIAHLRGHHPKAPVTAEPAGMTIGRS
jgi:tRNA dimethylallyltransferase